EHSKLLLSKEWLVKVDAQTSKPYLLKFYSSSVDLRCCVMVTDTRSTWAEVLSSNQFARRWRECNKRISPLHLDEEEEVVWRTRNLDILSSAHTLGAISDFSFEVVDSKFGDLAFEMECDAFKWRWETIFVGHKISADILSTHLIMPLISVNHLVLTSPNVVGDLSADDLEKAIDKVGRTARRTVDTHIKNALSKPRSATTLRRMTAVFNFISDLPKVTLTEEVPDLQISEPISKLKEPSPDRPSPTEEPTPETNRVAPTHRNSKITVPPSRRRSPITAEVDMDSATESEEENPLIARTKHAPEQFHPTANSKYAKSHPQSPNASKMASPVPSGTRSPNLTDLPSMDSDVQPRKKVRMPASSSSEDSEEERKKLAEQIRSGAAPKRGARQPLRRGGKRF
ncbi:hypothetical protein V8B97DRAFT_1870277, partial [Scleroderma yunnanense]